MGFSSVYRTLQDLFPTVDARLLKAIAIEHPKDVDIAAEVVITEVLPYVPEAKDQTFPVGIGSSDSRHLGEQHEKQGNLLRCREVKNKVDVDNTSSEPAIRVGNLVNSESSSQTEFQVPNRHNGTSFSSFCDIVDPNAQLSTSTARNDEVLVLTKSTGVADRHEPDLVSEATSTIWMHKQCASYDQDQGDGNSGGEEQVLQDSLETSVKFGAEQTSSYVALNTMFHGENDLCRSMHDQHHESKDDVDSSLNSVFPEVENSVPQLACSSVEKCKRSDLDFGNSDITSKQIDTNGSVVSDNESNSDALVTRSGQICRIDMLEELVEAAKTSKKALFSAMESVISMMKDVELHEKAAEQAKKEAAKGVSEILASVEDIKQMLARAKEANDMHAGDAYGEKAILATEARELQSRLLSLMDERDKSLAILDEMRHSLETRLAAAEEMMKSAEQEKSGKEESARKALAEQEAMMEKVFQESKLLEQEAEKNSKLREFLMERGRLVDGLQGEISVICQDVRLLKEKFDERIPLSQSFSSSQTTCRLASSSSSFKSMASDLAIEQGEACKTTDAKKSSPTSSDTVLVESGSVEVYGPLNSPSPVPLADGHSTRNRSLEERDSVDKKVVLDDGWEIWEEDECCDI